MSPARKVLIAVGAVYLVALLGLLVAASWDRAALWVVTAGFGVLEVGLQWVGVELCVE